MKRAIAWAFAGVCAAGCQNAAQPSDPFLNPARVPPPITGQITPLQPGLTGPPAGGTIGAPSPPVMSAPAVSLPHNQAPVPNQYVPPGGSYNYNRGAIPAPAPPASTVPPPGTMYPGATGSGSSIYQQPRSSWNRRGETSRQASSRNHRAATERPEGDDGQIVRTNFDEPSDGAVDGPPRMARLVGGPTDRGETYGYDAQYRWLHGRLEYLESRRQWKLRYIALDGTTDQYGGSVVLIDNGQLAGYRSGDFVSVQGQVESTSAEAQRGYAPAYRLAAIQRLSAAAP